MVSVGALSSCIVSSRPTLLSSASFPLSLRIYISCVNIAFSADISLWGAALRSYPSGRSFALFSSRAHLGAPLFLRLLLLGARRSSHSGAQLCTPLSRALPALLFSTFFSSWWMRSSLQAKICAVQPALCSLLLGAPLSKGAALRSSPPFC